MEAAAGGPPGGFLRVSPGQRAARPEGKGHGRRSAATPVVVAVIRKSGKKKSWEGAE